MGSSASEVPVDRSTLLLAVTLAFLGAACSSPSPGASTGGGSDSGATSSGGSSGAASSGGSSSGATSGTTGSVSCPGGCPDGTVCEQGACTAIPASCPCPKETYCDLATNTCKVGCLADADCDAHRICDLDARTCSDGCRQDADCASGQICDDTDLSCRAGCRDDSACPAGQVCDQGSLVCRAGCRHDSDCASGQICGVVDTCVSGCHQDSQCPLGSRCGSGETCVTGCTNSENCPLSTYCRSGQCASGCDGIGDVNPDRCDYGLACVVSEGVNGPPIFPSTCSDNCDTYPGNSFSECRSDGTHPYDCFLNNQNYAPSTYFDIGRCVLDCGLADGGTSNANCGQGRTCQAFITDSVVGYYEDYCAAPCTSNADCSYAWNPEPGNSNPCVCASGSCSYQGQACYRTWMK